jgi:hypothetical protein
MKSSRGARNTPRRASVDGTDALANVLWHKRMSNQSPFSRGPGVISHALHSLVSQIPPSLETPSDNPGERVKGLAKTAALKAAAVSGSFTLPPGPLGLATVVPDLLAVWRIQQQLVADIAGAYGKTSALTAESMVICLFKHGGAALTKGLFARQGDDIVVQRIANRTLLQLLEKIGVRIAQRIAAKSVSRWLPVLGALGAGAYAYYDTTHVATNAIDLFSGNVRVDSSDEPTEPVRSARKRTPKPAAGPARAAERTSKAMRPSKPAPRPTRRAPKKS